MIKQIDRVINDLRSQVTHFRQSGGNLICVAVVGVNHAESMIGYEGERQTPTTGRSDAPHSYREAPEAERRLRSEAASYYDEFIMLRFRANNAPPYLFEWVDEANTRLEYAAALARISQRYQQRP